MNRTARRSMVIGLVLNLGCSGFRWSEPDPRIAAFKAEDEAREAGYARQREQQKRAWEESQAREKARREAAFKQAEADDQKRREERERQEEQRHQQEEAKAKLEAGRAKDPKWMRPMLSAMICTYTSWRAGTLREAQTEKAYAAEVGGVINTRKMYLLQQQVRLIDRVLGVQRAAMARLHITSLPCSNKLVDELGQCVPTPPDLSVREPDYCEEERIKAYTDLVWWDQ